MNADSSEEIQAILEGEGYWTNTDMWRVFGDNPNNFGSIGNQQSDAVAALVEKIINCIDARLMSLAGELAIDPKSPDCPKDMREAIARFVERKEAPFGERDGRIFYWDDSQIRRESEKISLFATGKRAVEGFPCITISDTGEGQVPDRFPDTFMSLAKSNKMNIPFVQGKFNMGGTGVFAFCKGANNERFQLVVSRRNPALLPKNANSRDNQWGFTIIRRVTRDGMRSSMYEYLAPINQGVLSFDAAEMPLFPSDDKDRPRAYSKSVPYGSMVKLYEYECKYAKTNLTFAGSKGDSLKLKIEEALTEAALPVQIAECRPHFKEGRDRRSFVDEILGSITQLGNMTEDKRIERLEKVDPINGAISLNGTRLPITVYVFKDDSSSQKYNAKGIFFTINGQTHGVRSSAFFNRKKINLSYIKDSLFVVVNCTHMSPEMREELFMNSRDRMRQNMLSQELEQALEAFLGEEQTLQTLNRKRQEEKIKRNLEEQKPLEETLKQLVKVNPKLAELLPLGVKIPTNSFGLGTSDIGTNSFEGKTHPTFFRFKKNRNLIERNHPINQAIRIDFETDAVDNYFSRKTLPGELKINLSSDKDDQPTPIYRIGNLSSGVMSIVLHIDQNEVLSGDILEYEFRIEDETLALPFINRLVINVEAPVTSNDPGTFGKRATGTKPKGGIGGSQGVGLPNIVGITKNEWGDEWTESEALHIKSNPEAGFDFFYNKDNRDLLLLQSQGRVNPQILDSQYKIGLMLIALSVVESSKRDYENDENPIISGDSDLEKIVAEITRAISPFWLSILEGLSGLKESTPILLEE